MIELTTERLRLRPVDAKDLDVIVASLADERIMALLGGARTPEKSRAWLEKQLQHWRTHRFGRFAMERADSVVGFVGLLHTDFEAPFTPAIEVAWLLAFDHWGKGYATEAASAVVDDGFDRLGFAEIVAMTTPNNARSRRVMERLGMTHAPRGELAASGTPGETFEHPLLAEGNPLRTHVLYRLTRASRLKGPPPRVAT